MNRVLFQLEDNSNKIDELSPEGKMKRSGFINESI
jgi:hypothetical protein